jgi:hypothetical protein
MSMVALRLALALLSTGSKDRILKVIDFGTNGNFDQRLHVETLKNREEIAFKPPSELHFQVAERITYDEQYGYLRLEGRLTNPTARRVTIVVFPVGGYHPFWMDFSPASQVKRRPQEGPPRPESPPPPMRISVPAYTTVRFEATIDLSEYHYSGSPQVEVVWTFQYWNGPQSKGTLTVTLPPQQRQPAQGAPGVGDGASDPHP